MRGTACLVMVWLWAAVANAQPSLDAAVAHLDDGELESALADLEQATTEGLDREGLGRVVTFRAIIHNALGNEEQRDAALLILGTLVPLDQVDPRLPPLLVERARELGRDPTPLRLEVSVDRRPNEIVVEASVSHDTAGLVERVELSARLAGGLSWTSEHAARLSLPGEEPDADVEYFASAFGPHDIVVARAGTDAEPRVRRAEVEVEVPVENEAADDTGVIVGVLVGVGLAVLAGAGIGIAIGVSEWRGGSVRFGPPMVEF